VFELDNNFKVTAFKDINGRSAVIVDDFYRDPDEVRELAKSLTFEVELKGGLPGIRKSLDTPEVKEKLYDVYFNLCDMYFGNFDEIEFKKNWDVQGFMINITNDTSLKVNPLTAVIPHQDYWPNLPTGGHTLQFGSVVYLNTPDECAGGTNLYSWNDEMSITLDTATEWKTSQETHFDILSPVLSSMSDEDKFNLLKDRLESFNLKVEFKAEMKYNRMLLYQADVLHSPEIDLGMFTDYNRINQVFFL